MVIESMLILMQQELPNRATMNWLVLQVLVLLFYL